MISFVITTYGETEEQVRRALASLTALGEDLSEVIIIDDGAYLYDSSCFDGGYVGCAPVRVIRANHGGLSLARNCGIESSTGDYVAFLDGDDESALRDIGSILRSSPDVVRIGLKEINGNGEVRLYIPDDGALSGADYLNTYMQRGALVPSACVYIYRREWLLEHRIAFRQGLIHEDLLFVIESLCKAQRVVTKASVGYIYHRRADSITSSQDSGMHVLRLRSLRRIHMSLLLLQAKNGDLDLRMWLLKVRKYAESIALRSPMRVVKFQYAAMRFQQFLAGVFLRHPQDWRQEFRGLISAVKDWALCRTIEGRIDR